MRLSAKRARDPVEHIKWDARCCGARRTFAGRVAGAHDKHVIATKKTAASKRTRMEAAASKSRAARQIVLSGRATGHATRLRWSLAKAQDTPVGIRDVTEDAPEPEAGDR